MSTHTAIRLHPYQELAITRIEERRTTGAAKALLVLPTGTGKTITFGSYIQRQGVPTLVLAHREELLVQARDKLAVLGVPLARMGLVGAGFEETGRQITIASVQSLARPKRLAQMARAGIRLVVVDEAHHRAASTYGKVLDALGEDAFELGVTATPDRLDGKSLEEIYGPAIEPLKLPEAIRDGWLCDLVGIQVKTGMSLDGVHTRMGDFADGELSAALDTPERNKVIVDAWLRNAPDRLTLTFAASVQHAYDLAEAFRAEGVTAAALDGTTDRDDRRHLLRDFAAGRIRNITNCLLFTEGLDLPETSCIVLARPTQSRALYCQMVGRGTRTAPGKRNCLVLDIADLTTRHSLTVQSLPQLIGRQDYPKASASVKSEDETGAEDDADAGFSLRTAITGPVIDKTVNLLGKAFEWKQSPKAGNYFMRMPNGATFWLALHDDGYAAGVIWSDGQKQELTHEHMPLDWAQVVAEQSAAKVRDGQAVLVDRRAPWRYQEPTDAQRWKLRKLRVKYAPGITRGEAADLITAAMAKQAS